MAINAAQAIHHDSDVAAPSDAGYLALMPEPFEVNAEAVNLAAAAARAALRRTSAAIFRFARPPLPGHPNPQLDPFLAAVQPTKLP